LGTTLNCERGDYLFLLRYVNRAKRNSPNVSIKDIDSNVDIGSASFQVGLRKTNHRLSELSLTTHNAIALVGLYRITHFSTSKI